MPVAPARPVDPPGNVLLVAFDGSPAAAEAIAIGARLLPASTARIAYVWGPPFASAELRQRLLWRAGNLDGLIAAIEREGASEAGRLAAEGVTLARAAGWAAEPLVHRSHAGEGLELARLAEQEGVTAVVLGSRGLSGARAVLGSTSDAVAHYSPVPVLVVPRPLLVEEREAVASGPVLAGHDGSDGARVALAAAATMFTGRELIVATVADEPVGGEELTQAGASGAEVVSLEPVGMRDSARAVAGALARRGAERGGDRRRIARPVARTGGLARQRRDGGPASRPPSCARRAARVAFEHLTAGVEDQTQARKRAAGTASRLRRHGREPQ